jgi:toxin CcdB
MARFEILELQDGALVLDCQADLLSRLRTRFVVPLLPFADASIAADRLNPLLDLAGGRFVMVTQAAATIEVREIKNVVGSARKFESEIMNALDMLLTGY